MAGLEIADYAALALYFLLIAFIGVRSVRHVKSLADFVMPRRFGKLFMLMHSFGTNTHSDQAVSVASKSGSERSSSVRVTSRAGSQSPATVELFSATLSAFSRSTQL